jgi:glycosyltransferase involved in cell wall biosynthesis
MGTSLAACLITAGEPSLEKAIASVRPHVDQVVVVLTKDVGEQREAEVRKLADVFERNLSWLDEKGRFSDFGAARQRSFDLATTDAAFWVDSDDVVRGAENLREVAESMEGPAIAKFEYEYEHDQDGRVTTTQVRERLVKPVSAFAWKFRVHEALVPVVDRYSVETSDAVVFVHGRSGDGHLARNVRILRSVLTDDPNDLRSVFYLGLELFKAGDFDRARSALLRVADEDAPAEEKVVALIRLSEIARTRGECPDAMMFASRALSIRPWDSCCFALARACHAVAERTGGAERLGAWEHAAFWARAGLATPPAQTGLWTTPLDRAGLIDLTLHAALAALGDVVGARESVGRAIAVLPDEPSLAACALVYDAALARRAQEDGKRRAEAAAAQAEALRKAGKINRVTRDAVYLEGGLTIEKPAGSLDVVFACGDAPEPWNPTLMEDRGIGGSEQAVVNLAALLARRGHRVRVYASCGLSRSKYFDGVEYYPTRAIVRAGECDVLVAWRDAAALEVASAKVRLLWAHDAGIRNVTEWRGALVDRVMALSEWHRECLSHAYREIPAEKFRVTRNGVDLSLFEQAVERDPEKAVYSSSPTRGLLTMLDLWPDIVGEAKALGARDPKLHVFYGFESTLAMAKAAGDEQLLAFVEACSRRVKECEKLGVVARGRIPPRQLAREMLSAGAWLYPSWDDIHNAPWMETSCIGAMEAQVAGLQIVTHRAGALPETVGTNGVFVDECPRVGAGLKAFVAHAARALVDPGVAARDAIALVGRNRFSWEPVAEEWEKLMLALVAEKETEG